MSLISIPLEFAALQVTWTVSPFTCKNNAGGVEKSSCWKESAVRFHTPLNMSIHRSWVPLQHLLPRQIRHSRVMLNGLHPWEIITRQWASQLHFMFWCIGREKDFKVLLLKRQGRLAGFHNHTSVNTKSLPPGSADAQRWISEALSGVFGGMIAFWRRWMCAE